MNKNIILKAKRATVKFSQDLEVDGYMLPDGEFRVGKMSISKTLGYGKDWVTRQIKKAETLVASSTQIDVSNPNKIVQKQPQTLVASLLTKLSLDTKFVEIDGIAVETLSLGDFRVLIRHADRLGNIKAQALLDALLDVSLEDWFRLSFGMKELTLEEKRAKFYTAFAATIDWEQEDRDDLALIEEQEAFLNGDWD